MISYLKGELAEFGDHYIVIEIGSIGYEVSLSSTAIAKLPSIGSIIKIHTYTHVREDVLALFGFLTKDDLEMFKLLITVNGIGPKGALGILSGLTADEIRFAVLADDIKTITTAPGVGKKTASKLILELKDKFELATAFEQRLMNQADAPTDVNTILILKDETVQALIALGYTPAEATRAVSNIEITENMNIEELLKLSLKNV